MAASITHTPAPENFRNPYVLVLVDGNGYIVRKLTWDLVELR